MAPRCNWKFKPHCEHKHDLDGGRPNASSALRSHLRPQPVRMISSAIIMALPFFGAAQKYLYLYSDPYKYSLQTFEANIVLAQTKQYYNQNKY